MTVDDVSLAIVPCGAGSGYEGGPLAYAAICAYNAATALPPLKLADYSGTVLRPTVFLMIVMSF